MPLSTSARIRDYFASLRDPRRREVVGPLIDNITIALCAVVAGADDVVAIAESGRKKPTRLSQFLDLRGGVPSHDRFHAILGALRPAEFGRRLLSWITALHELRGGQVVAIDGKTLRRGDGTAGGKSAIPMVSAWATANHISPGQVVVDQKSDEITAIPKLLRILELSGCLVTSDAMGCQTEIAQAIVDAGADDVLAVKGDRPTLHDGIVEFFLDHPDDDFARVKVSRHETDGCGHGGFDPRWARVIRWPDPHAGDRGATSPPRPPAGRRARLEAPGSRGRQCGGS